MNSNPNQNKTEEIKENEENIQKDSEKEKPETTEAIEESTENTEEKEEKKEETKESKEEQLSKELEEQKDKYLRLLAEYDNFRKRSAKERVELEATVTGNTLAEILPVFDNFERALNAETADENYKQGVAMIFNQFGEMLKKLGVEVIDPTGEVFDPNVANAVSQTEDAELGENVVAQVFQKGYKIGGKVIRYAMVCVANP